MASQEIETLSLRAREARGLSRIIRVFSPPSGPRLLPSLAEFRVGYTHGYGPIMAYESQNLTTHCHIGDAIRAIMVSRAASSQQPDGGGLLRRIEAPYICLIEHLNWLAEHCPDLEIVQLPEPKTRDSD